MEPLVILVLLVLLGYVLGIIGFFRANAALREVRALRRQLADGFQLRSTGDVVEPFAARGPGPVPGPVLDAMPPGANDLVTEPPNAGDATGAAPLEAEPVGPAAARPAAPDLESVLTMRWAVWLGAVALLLAGVFLVRYASDQGLLGPATRCGAAVVLGAALLAGAAWLRHRPLPPIPGPFDADQAPPALAAGGVAVLFGAAYGAGPYYDLLPAAVAFAGMAAVAGLGLLASLLFGPLTAAVGIVGAFATPALVSTASPSLPGLFAYLAVVTAAAHAAVRRTGWVWLGWAVTLAGAGWVLVAAGLPHDPGIWAAAAFVPVSVLLGLLLPPAAMDAVVGRALAWGQFATVALVGIVLEAAAPGYATRAALFALTPLAIWKGAAEPRLDRLPWLAAGVGVAALWFWSGVAAAPAGEPAWALLGAPVDRGGGILLAAAVALAGVHAATGLVGERRVSHPVRWSALVAAVPVLVLAVAYARVGRFEVDARWGLAGLLLAALLTLAAQGAMGREATDRAGAHAAGAVAALALALAMMLRQQWLGTALALVLPGLAWVEARTGLRALRVVAAVAAAVVITLVPGWLLHDVALGHSSVAGDPFTAYAIPAAAFAVAARVFRRGGDDRLVAALEACAVATAALFVVVEVRLRFGQGAFNAALSFDEAATLMLTAGAQAIAYDHAARRTGRRTAMVARRALGRAAYLLAVGLLVANPFVTDARVGAWSLALGYLAPALAAAWVGWAHRGERVARWLCGYAVLAGLAWVTLQVRLAFHPGAVGVFASVRTQAELWSWSAGWLAYALVLMAMGLRLGARLLRLVALALVALVSLKVFLVDMGELTGLLRVVSFLGLGLILIALGALHRRFVLTKASTDAPA